MFATLARHTRGSLAAIGFTTAAALAGATPSQAITIQPVTSPGGIEAWLVEDATVPVVMMNFAWKGAGGSQDPADTPGVAGDTVNGPVSADSAAPQS